MGSALDRSRPSQAFFRIPLVHSYLVLAYSEVDKVSLSVGFCYTSNAAGRLLGVLLSGVLYQQDGVVAALWGAVCLAGAAGAALFEGISGDD